MLSGNPAYKKASQTIWQDAVSKKMYLIGNYGSHRDYEDFGDAFELPNISCWNEACSGIGNIYWNQNLFLLNGDSKYIDCLERCLYNGFLAAVSLDGQRYFYQNVLETFGDFERNPWYGPNCCPPNIARLMATLGSYIYAHSADTIYVNLYIGSNAGMKLGENDFVITQETNYPWDGIVKIALEPRQPAKCEVRLRIPGWAQNEAVPSDLYKFVDKQKENIVLKVNGQPVKVNKQNGFAVINRTWNEGDVIELQLPMPVRKVIANKGVLDDRDRIALERGPLVYCAESIDNGGNVFDKYVPANAALKGEFNKNILGGVVVVNADAVSVSRSKDQASIERRESKITAVPYYAWANRGNSQMLVWLAADADKVIVPPKPTIASTSKISSSCGQGSLQDNYPGSVVPTIARRFFPRSQSGAGGLNAICDNLKPVSSEDGFAPYLQLRPQQGDQAWVQIDCPHKTKVSECSVYWKDDKEYCTLPKSWQILYWDGSDWKPVKTKNQYRVQADKYNKITFEPVETDKLRLAIVLAGQKFAKGQLGPPDANYLRDELIWYECGILQWQVK